MLLTPDGLAQADHIIALKTQTEQSIFDGVDRDLLDRVAGDLRTLLAVLERDLDPESAKESGQSAR